ncbi:MAG: hypothetical protein K2O22_05355, partial [Anaeroplasmataceae bacterium]|nr:hypothetical protein [Anaeroplasmataceae bacterium]
LFDIAGALYFLSAVFLLLGSPLQFLHLLKNNTKEVIGILFTCIGLILLAFPSQIQTTYLTIGGATASEENMLQSYTYTYFDMFRISPKLVFTSILPLILTGLGVFGKGLLCQGHSSNKGYFVGITDGLIFTGVVLISRTLASFVNLSVTDLNITITVSKVWGSIAGLIVIFLANGISIAFNLFSMLEKTEFLEKNERIFILITWMIILYFVLVGCIIWL